MVFEFLRKKPRKAKAVKRRRPRASGLEEALKQLSTKKDVERIIGEVVSSRDAVVKEIAGIADSFPGIMAEQITSPLKEFISSELEKVQGGSGKGQALKQLEGKRLSASQADKGLDEVIADMKMRLEMLSQRHIKILNVLVQNRGNWLSYEDVGQFCEPQLTGSCIRGYIADLINSYRIPIEKKTLGRKGVVKISGAAVKQLAISKLAD